MLHPAQLSLQYAVALQALSNLQPATQQVHGYRIEASDASPHSPVENVTSEDTMRPAVVQASRPQVALVEGGGHCAEVQEAADHQSFQEFNSNSWDSWSNFSYLLSDNGKLSASELAFVFKTSVSAMNKSYDEVQIKEIVEALWEDWGLDSHKDDLEISKVREMLSTHEGLNEGLTKR